MGFSSGSWSLKAHQHTGVGDGGKITAGEDIELQSEKGLILNYGTGNIKLLCVSNQDKATLRDGTNTVDASLTAQNILAYGNLDTNGNVGVAGTVDGVDVSKLGLGKQYVIGGGGPVHSFDASGSSAAGSYTKVKTITFDELIPSPVTLRITFEFRQSEAYSTVYARIYKNGVAFGSAQSTGSGDWQSATEDLSFSKGDALELYVYTSHAGYPVWYRNFRIYGSEDDLASLDQAINNGDIDSDPLQATNS